MATQAQQQHRKELRSMLDGLVPKALLTGDISNDYLTFLSLLQRSPKARESQQEVLAKWNISFPDADPFTAAQYAPRMEEVNEYLLTEKNKAEAEKKLGEKIEASGGDSWMRTLPSVESDSSTYSDHDSAISQALKDRPKESTGEDSDEITQEATDAIADSTSGSATGAGGSSGSGSAAGSGEPMAADDPSWTGLPYGGELWNVDGTVMVAYPIDEDDPNSGWVTYGFQNPEAFKRAFPGSNVPPINKITREEHDAKGAVYVASTNLLRSLDEGWEEGFYHSVDRATERQPWLNNPDITAEVLTATLEGRPADVDYIKNVSGLSDREIEWMNLTLYDPERAEQKRAAERERINSALKAAGVRNPPDSAIDYLAEKSVSGQWDDADLGIQVRAIANPYSDAATTMDEGLSKLLAGEEVQTLAADTRAVQDTVRKWLGPMAKSWSDEQARSWAGAIADDPAAEEDLLEALQKQRLALFPEYDNPNLSYEDIAAPWQTYMANQWGESANALDEEVLHKVIRANDVMEAGKILRGEGMKRGNKKVEMQAANEMLSAFGGPVVNPL